MPWCLAGAGSIDLKHTSAKKRRRCHWNDERHLTRSHMNTKMQPSAGVGVPQRKNIVNAVNPWARHGYTSKFYMPPTYKIWAGMMRRCYTPTVKSFKDYGGRGISVCEGMRSYPGFLKAVGERPGKLTLDRPNNSNSYSCGSCPECTAMGWTKNARWLPKAEQANNTRKSRRVTLNGRTQTLADWCREYGIRQGIVSTRMVKGWSEVEAITTPIDRKRSEWLKAASRRS